MSTAGEAMPPLESGVGGGHEMCGPPTSTTARRLSPHSKEGPEGLNVLIRALEDDSSPPGDDAGTVHKPAAGLEVFHQDDELRNVYSSDATESAVNKQQTAGPQKRKGERSTDVHVKSSIMKRSRKSDRTTVLTTQDFSHTIEEAANDQRIDAKKAARLTECLQSADWTEIAFNLLCEQIPLRRKGKGYLCRVCQVPKKGHSCSYCQVCSDFQTKYKKDDGHVCVNCIACFEHGKKNKKLIQVGLVGHVCPHGGVLP